MTKASKDSEDKKGPSDKEVKVEFSLDGLFKGLGGLMNLVTDAVKEGEGTEVTRTGNLSGLPRDAKGVYGFTIKHGIGGSPAVERFGNIRETKKGPVVEAAREPIVDVFDEKDKILVVIELPGVHERDIDLEVKGNSLILSARSDDRKYNKNIPLPGPANTEILKSSYKNGILEITLAKKAPARKRAASKK